MSVSSRVLLSATLLWSTSSLAGGGVPPGDPAVPGSWCFGDCALRPVRREAQPSSSPIPPRPRMRSPGAATNLMRVLEPHDDPTAGRLARLHDCYLACVPQEVLGCFEACRLAQGGW